MNPKTLPLLLLGAALCAAVMLVSPFFAWAQQDALPVFCALPIATTFQR